MRVFRGSSATGRSHSADATADTDGVAIDNATAVTNTAKAPASDGSRGDARSSASGLRCSRRRGSPSLAAPFSPARWVFGRRRGWGV